jgi:large subunit ribosomal protein L19
MGLIEKIEAAQIRTDRPDMRPGDTVEVSVRVIEGDKERQQKFRGEVINVRGSGVRKSFTVRKISEGIGVERTFPVSSPSVADIKVMKHSKVRRAKLFYLRGRTGKSARLTERTEKKVAPAAAAKSSKKVPEPAAT